MLSIGFDNVFLLTLRKCLTVEGAERQRLGRTSEIRLNESDFLENHRNIWLIFCILML